MIGRIGWNSISVISVSLINSYFILFSWEQSLKADQLIVAIRAVKLLKIARDSIPERNFCHLAVQLGYSTRINDYACRKRVWEIELGNWQQLLLRLYLLGNGV